MIATDMGGTTFDVSVIRDGVPLQREVSILQRYELALPALDIESVGAGGGSVAWIDESGRLNVGPHSAGADPGPASYGRGGTETTVTDADVILGVIRPEAFLNGRMPLDAALAEEAIGRLAARLDLSTPETAAGINRIVDSRMADLIRRMSLMRGLDPRNFTCFAYGGGGPVHAAAVARETGIRKVVVPIPRVGALWSALGAATADVTHVYQEAETLTMPADPAKVSATFRRLEDRARTTLEDEGFGDRPIAMRRVVRMKFTAQVHDVEVPVGEGDLDEAAIAQLDEDFGRIYEELFGPGSGYREGGVQIDELPDPRHRRAPSGRLRRGSDRGRRRAQQPPRFLERVRGLRRDPGADARERSDSRRDVRGAGPARVPGHGGRRPARNDGALRRARERRHRHSRRGLTAVAVGSAMAVEGLSVDRPAEGVTRITLDRPHKRNALTVGMLEALPELFAHVRDDGTHAVVIAGAGGHFSAGGDVDGFAELATDDDRRAQMRRSYSAFTAIEQLELPVIGAVGGIAYGGGTELALACDLVVAARDARFLLPEAGLGLLAGFGIDRATRIAGPRVAARLALVGAPLMADEALACGLVTKLVEPEDLEASALELAVTVARLPAPAVAAIKAMLREPAHDALERAIERNVELFASPEHAEALARFPGPDHEANHEET